MTTTKRPTDLRWPCATVPTVALMNPGLGFPTYCTRLAAATMDWRGLCPAGFRLLGPPCESLPLNNE